MYLIGIQCGKYNYIYLRLLQEKHIVSRTRPLSSEALDVAILLHARDVLHSVLQKGVVWFLRLPREHCDHYRLAS